MYPYTSDNNNKSIFATKIELPEPEESTSRFAQLLEEGADEERQAISYYEYMAENTADKNCASIYTSMADDDRYHLRLLDEIYKDLTGIAMVTKDVDISKEQENNMFLNEIETSKFYRDLFAATEDDDFKNILSIIINDKQNHAMLNMYIALNCKDKTN